MNRKHLSLFTRISRWVSRSGDGFLYILFAVYLYWSGVSNDKMFLLCALLAFIIERPLYFVVKNSLKRNRPQDALQNFRSVIIPSDKFSFPSGHTSGAFLMATLLASFYPTLSFPAYIWASSVGLSRIFLGVHFPTDILVGMIMGTSMATLALELLIA
jgi:undecaprenyl-diphosphatase